MPHPLRLKGVAGETEASIMIDGRRHHRRRNRIISRTDEDHRPILIQLSMHCCYGGGDCSWHWRIIYTLILILIRNGGGGGGGDVAPPPNILGKGAELF